MRVLPQFSVLALLAAVALAARARPRQAGATGPLSLRPLARIWAPPILWLLSITAALAIAELTLRLVGTRVSSGISAVRHDLGNGPAIRVGSKRRATVSVSPRTLTRRTSGDTATSFAWGSCLR